ncbi:MAG: tRNA dihydrouridine synthase DusB [Pseudomonadales bacterium]
MALFTIGPYSLRNRFVLAPMAGVTDLPFRELAWRMGAGLVVSEMVTSRPELLDSKMTRARRAHVREAVPRVVQIAGAEPELLAHAARFNVAQGAQIIDINMGCPAKKVCNKLAGSALLRDERLVEEILKAVIAAVDTPVTLKMRTGWSFELRNGISIARIAEDVGIGAIAVHGRTRACRFEGAVEYDTITQIKQAVDIPVIANGDIDSPDKARMVLDYTGADAVMVGRAAQGCPWLAKSIGHYLETGEKLPEPSGEDVAVIIEEHLCRLYDFYGGERGIRIARKHVGWYLKSVPGGDEFRRAFNQLESSAEQVTFVRRQIGERLRREGALPLAA